MTRLFAWSELKSIVKKMRSVLSLLEAKYLRDVPRDQRLQGAVGKTS